ncbi:MAG: DNA primase [Muribaculaceae bacterium]|nr:DNA primase [Muribaculaceae bacterium]
MIDRETVDRILDTADIVDVVSDFVSLRRRGANFIGLCPFHDEKTPSFSVSPSKQICHCFGCGKGGSPVNFIMEHEQMSYVEALRYLAKKYHIEIVEKELTSEEKAAQTERESMLVINEFAAQYFEDQLFNTQEGKNIGLSYFYERGFNDATIKKFHLGYSPQDSKAFYTAATGKGYNKKFLFETGLCIDDRRGGGFDRFHGRVMFPVMNIAGKVIAFGGRTLKKTKEVAKYFNSPESAVYVKNRELYGLFQAKRAISKEDKCFLVEGYTDVISMHQAGVENVVASSGTSLTEGQIRAIHRFTTNVTVLYDGDSAGIHASLRGIDMLLAEGLSVKVLLLPDGEDPDSFARSHSASEFKKYIEDNETDFISFKTRVMLEGTERDPIKRAAVIGDVVKSISVIPDAIARSVYAQQCSIQLGIAEDVLIREIQKNITRNREEAFKRKQREKNREDRRQGRQQSPAPELPPQDAVPSTPPPLDDVPPVTDGGMGYDDFEPPVIDAPPAPYDYGSQAPEPVVAPATTREQAGSSDDSAQYISKQVSKESVLYLAEKGVLRNIVKYGMCYLCDTVDGNGESQPTSVLEYIINEFLADSIDFTIPAFKKTFDASKQYINEFYQALAIRVSQEQAVADEAFNKAVRLIDTDGMNVAAIEKKEDELKSGIMKEKDAKINEFRKNYLEKKLCSHIDDDVRSTALSLVSEKHQLSKIYSIENFEHSIESRLKTIIPESINNLKNSNLNYEIIVLKEKMKHAQGDQALELMSQLQNLYQTRKELAKYIGERVVNP